jgi:hypothetical protein
MKTFWILPLSLLFAFSACKKDDDAPAPTSGNAMLVFDQVWAANADPFFMNVDTHHPKTGDTLNFSTFKYYVSNVRLKKSDGTWWEAQDFYHLVDLMDPTSLNFTFTGLPVGDYVTIEFLMGIDSARVVNGPYTGDLDPSNGMYAGAAEGYIMIMAKGFAPYPTNAAFEYEIKGYSGADKVTMLKLQNLPATNPLKVTGTSVPKLHIVANPARLFHSFGSVSKGNVTTAGIDAATMAFTFNDAVTIGAIEN